MAGDAAQLEEEQIRKMREEGIEDPQILRITVRRADGQGVDIWEIGKPFPDPFGRQVAPPSGDLDRLPIEQRREFVDCYVLCIFYWPATKATDDDGAEVIEEAYYEVIGRPWILLHEAKGKRIPEEWKFSAGYRDQGEPAGTIPRGARVRIPARRMEEVWHQEPLLNTKAYVQDVLEEDEEEAEPTPQPTNGTPATPPVPPS